MGEGPGSGHPGLLTAVPPARNLPGGAARSTWRDASGQTCRPSGWEAAAGQRGTPTFRRHPQTQDGPVPGATCSPG